MQAESGPAPRRREGEAAPAGGPARRPLVSELEAVHRRGQLDAIQLGGAAGAPAPGLRGRSQVARLGRAAAGPPSLMNRIPECIAAHRCGGRTVAAPRAQGMVVVAQGPCTFRVDGEARVRGVARNGGSSWSLHSGHGKGARPTWRMGIAQDPFLQGGAICLGGYSGSCCHRQRSPATCRARREPAASTAQGGGRGREQTAETLATAWVAPASA